MKIQRILITGIFLCFSAFLYSGDLNQQAAEFVKNCILKAKGGKGYLALRYFQYLSTTIENNPSSYIVSSPNHEILDQIDLSESDNGKYIPALKDRSSTRIYKLWNANKKELLSLLTHEEFSIIAASHVDNLIGFYSSPEYKQQITEMRKLSPRLNNSTINIAQDVTKGKNYNELAFWYRRTIENNDKIIISILKEIKSHYPDTTEKMTKELSPEEYAWWLRITFEPVHKEIQGIPVNNIDPSWILASQLNREAFPKHEIFFKKDDSMERQGIDFIQKADFNRDGIMDMAIVGVFKNANRQTGNFILILTNNKKSEWEKVFIKSWVGKPGFMGLSVKENNLRLWMCMHCDGHIAIKWNKRINNYEFD